MSSPVKRYTREVVLAPQAIVATPTPTTILVPRPVTLTPVPPVSSFTTLSPTDQQPLSAKLPVPASNPRGTAFPNILATPADDLSELGGLVSVKLTSGALLVAAVVLMEVNIVDLVGNIVDRIFTVDGVVANGLPMDSASLANLLRNIPLLRKQTLSLVVRNTGGLIAAGALLGLARFDLGINAQQPFDATQFPSL